MPATSCGFSNPYTLTLRGPSVAVEIGIDPAFQPGLGLRSLLPPNRFQALVDTGALESCIDDELAMRLNLPVLARRQVSGVGGTLDVNEYMAQIYVPELNFTILGPFAGVHLAAGHQPHYALIGRTFLQHFNMAYEGRTGSVILSND